VSQLALDEEARALDHEVKDYQVLAQSELNKMRDERHALMKHSWEHLQVLIEHLPDRDLAIVHALLFRDLYHVLELYMTHQKAEHPMPPASDIAQPKACEPEFGAFREFLFDP
jgi:hypothetical protein